MTVQPGMPRAIVLLSVGVLLGGEAGAAESADTHAVGIAGSGATLCMEYLTGRLGANQAVTDLSYLSWSQGWMSALNARRSAGRPAVDLDKRIISLENQIDRLVSYCRAHPNEPMWQAASSLYQDFADIDPVWIKGSK